MRNLIGLVALMSLTGCLRTAGSWEGIWFIEVPVDDTYECETDIDENFKDARVYEEDDPVVGDWTYEYDFKGSNGGFFMQVLFEDGVAIGIIEDEVYVGREVKGKSITLTWESSEDSEDWRTHDLGYEYGEVVSGKLTETITLTKADKNAYTGTFDIASDSSTQYIESDEWDRDVNLEFGDIPAYILEATDDDLIGNTNTFNVDECNGDDCEITVSSSCSGTTDLTATYVGKHNEGMYEGLDDAGRDPGLGGGGGGYTTYSYY